MDVMTPPAHAKPVRQYRDYLWVGYLIAIPAAVEVSASWARIGALSGFPVVSLFGLLRFSTAPTLMVGMEAYAGYAMYFWLAAAPGERSRKFAMRSAIAAGLLSIIGQVCGHLVTGRPAVPVVAFISSLPVVLLLLFGILVHLVHADRGAAAELAADAAAADEADVLRADLAAHREALAAAQSERDEAQRAAAEATAKAEVANRKLGAAVAAKRNRRQPQKKGSAVPAIKVPRDVSVQAEALSIVVAEPDITGKDLGDRVGRSERWGQDFKKNLAGTAGPATGAAP